MEHPSEQMSAPTDTKDNVKANCDFLLKISEVLGRPMTVAECYVAYNLRDGKYKMMNEVPSVGIR
jgi:hypothetical protein